MYLFRLFSTRLWFFLNLDNSWCHHLVNLFLLFPIHIFPSETPMLQILDNLTFFFHESLLLCSFFKLFFIFFSLCKSFWMVFVYCFLYVFWTFFNQCLIMLLTSSKVYFIFNIVFLNCKFYLCFFFFLYLLFFPQIVSVSLYFHGHRDHFYNLHFNIFMVRTVTGVKFSLLPFYGWS